MRRKDSSRKQARDRAKENKAELKRQKKEEIAKLKALKREEILEKLRRADHLAKGNLFKDKSLVERIQKELETEFIPDVYDKTMAKLFNEKYYEDEDDKEDEIEANKVIDMKLLQDQENEVGDPDAHEYLEANDKCKQDFEDQMGKTVAGKVQEIAHNKLLEEGYSLWYSCDNCMQAIPELMYRFDCQKCDNFTLCLQCYKDNTTHAHRFKKQKVPLNQGPPQNSSDLLAKAYMQCCTCKKSLLELSKRVYVCETCSENIAEGDAIYWCKKCQETTEHEHKRTKLKAGTGEKSSVQPEDEAQHYLDNLFEDYHNLECEDIIGGGAIKARFGYQKVEKADFGLTDEDIFLLDDRALNQLVSIKNYRPFKHIGADG